MRACPGQLHGKGVPVLDKGAPGHRPVSRDARRLGEEREIVARIRAGDGRGARDLADKILGRYVLSSHARLEEARIRAVELFVILSRAVVDSGGPEDAVLRSGMRGIERIMTAQSVHALYSRAGPALDRLLDYVRTESADEDMAVVRRACDVMASRYMEKLSIKDIAGAVYVSPHHLCRLFRRKLSQSVMERLTMVRIVHARRLLETTSLKVSEIARMVGLTNSAHFCRVFKRCTGMSPAQYRRQSVDSRAGAVSSAS